MKTLNKAAWILLLLISWIALVPAQETPSAPPIAPAQQPPAPAPAAPVTVNDVQLVIEGKVINVHDGDTVTVLDQNNKKYNIRLHGIDAPELKQEFGSVSQKNLSRMVLGKQVSVYWAKVDKYRRTVGTIKIDGRDINIEQVRAGLAWHFKRYQDEQEPADRVAYSAAEQQARADKLGLWEDPDPTAPGDWRLAVRMKRWGPPPPEGTIIGNSNSKRYHRPDCEGYRNMAERNRVFFKTVAEAEEAGYKRAGNCPAEIQVAKSASDPVASVVAATTAVVPAPTAPAGVTTVTTSPASPPSSLTKPVDVTISPVPSTFVTASPNGHASAAVDEKIIGNNNSKKYHRPGCPGYSKVSEKNRVLFNTVAEAEAAGYTRAGNCPTDDQAESKSADTPATSPAPAQLTTPAAAAVMTAPPATASAALVVNEKIIGNSNSKKYHREGCPGYKTVSEKNRVIFKNVAEAEAAGYKRAGNCPEETTPPAANISETKTLTPMQVVTPGATAPAVATSSSTTLPPTPPTPVPVPGSTAPPNPPSAASETGATGKVVGNKNSKVYHLPGCPSYGRVSEKNQVLFDTAGEAEKAGFKIASNCSANKPAKE